jgi:hypothetical protein
MMSENQNTEVDFKPVDSRLKGVGGWLLLFIVGQLVLRPLVTWADFADPESASVSQLSENFPATATILTIERVIIIHLILFGIAVALALWKVRTPYSVKLTKIYLIANPIILILESLLYYFSDLPPDIRSSVIAQGFYNTGKVVIWSVVWFLYFTKSERVRATYLTNNRL